MNTTGTCVPLSAPSRQVRRIIRHAPGGFVT
jgi:hypothetical protein